VDNEDGIDAPCQHLHSEPRDELGFQNA
jgi:hypothetical protein